MSRSVQFDENSLPLKAFNFVQGITEWKNLINELSRYKSRIELAPLLITGLDFNIFYCLGCEMLYGFTKDQTIGECVPISLNRIFPVEIRKFKNDLLKS